MARTKPGLPDGFELKLDSPSTLGDYLDEGVDQQVARAFVSKQRTAVAQVEQRVEPASREGVASQATPQPPVNVLPNRPHAISARDEQVLNLADARRRSTSRAQVAKRPERIQVNMRPETQRMFGELVAFVQRYSLQDDATGSEILDALISVLHQARDELAFDDVPRRGKWGTPTARAFPTALGNAFGRAIAGSYSKSGRGGP